MAGTSAKNIWFAQEASGFLLLGNIDSPDARGDKVGQDGDDNCVTRRLPGIKKTQCD